MTIQENNTIAPKLLHKGSSDDVLLCSPRKIMPAIIMPKGPISQNVSVILNAYYHRNGNGDYTFIDDHNESLSEVEFEGDAELISQGIPFQRLDSLSKKNNLDHNFINAENVASFLNECHVERYSTSFQLVNNADHYFFYRKQHEHVPGIMFMEAARQAIYYQLYTYSQHQLGKVTVSLSKMQADFYSYCELMYPVEIVVDDFTLSKSSTPKEIAYSISFYQQAKLIARIKTVAPVISIGKFKLARNVLLNTDNVFKPLSHSPLTVLITSHDLRQNIVILKSVSGKGCVTSRLKNKDIEKAIVTFVYDNSISFSTSIYRIGESNGEIHWLFERVSFEELESLKEMIKRGFVENSVETNVIGE
ncbi:AfsA-related hotdog domain-containing protein [Buttiauxella sp. WJP83]|uniref:AfsA-related hotdog domain-containing protein n=1 Tax=Buttiauxella sp. WJP83 TaxID=2986951 RepID=UPI0022DD6F6F|nr:AfsA-related hotdog domain-containing protein [Buttiauxella sp. WJP83]WBM68817.1 AfsA-related hotdog domain-containing protein [Buttiauxella sp. WJP83]